MLVNYSTVVQQLSEFQFADSPFRTAINALSKSKDASVLGPRETVELIDRVYNFGLSDAEETVLAGIVARMPKGMRTGEKISGRSILQQVNLLPVLSQAKAEISRNINNISESNQGQILKSLQTVIDKVTNSYIEQERVKLQSSMTADQLGSTSMEQDVQRLRSIVTAPDYVPSLAQGLKETAGSDDFPNVEGQENFQAVASMGGGTGFVEEEVDWTSIARSDPNIRDLSTFEQIEEAGGFDMGNWDRWLNPGKKFVGTKEDGSNVTWTARDAVQYLYELDEKGDYERIKQVQNMLRKGGYFAPTSEGPAPLPLSGILDQSTVQAWNLFLTDAVRSGRTPADHYKDRLMKLSRIRSGDVDVPAIDDPAGARSLVQQLAQRVLGRGINEDEMAKLFKAVDGWRREALTLGFSAADPAQVDFNARIENYLATQNEEEIQMGRLLGAQDYYRKIFGE